MKRLFDFSIIKTFWAARFQSIFESLFGKSSAPKPVESAKVFVQKSSQNQPAKREMHSTTIVKAAAFRKPMIKFIGARLPRPFFDASALPPLQVSGNIVSASASAPKTASSIGPVGKIPRGQGVDPAQLPLKFRRDGLSEEECEAVNSGFFYQR